MEDLFSESGTFTHGMLSDGRYHKEFVLVEEVMAHTLQVANDSTYNRVRLYGDKDKDIKSDEAYYSACLLAKRLTVAGIETVTPEMVERLSRNDGQRLMIMAADLEQRRELFRSSSEVNTQGRPGTAKDGVQGGGDPPDESGKSPGV